MHIVANKAGKEEKAYIYTGTKMEKRDGGKARGASQKIVGGLPRGVGLNLARGGVELEEILVHVFPNL